MASFRFESWLVHQVGYEAMLARSRRELHAACASAIEAVAGDAIVRRTDDELGELVIERAPSLATLEPDAVVVSGHWVRAQRVRRAGWTAVLGAEVATRAGDFAPAIRAASTAHHLLSADAEGTAAAACAWARALERSGRYDEALALVVQAGPALEATETGPRNERLSARIEIRRGQALARLARFDEALAALHLGIERARVCSAADQIGEAWVSVGGVHWARGEHDAAGRAADEAAEAYLSAGDRGGLATTAANRSNVRADGGDLDGAIADVVRAAAIHDDVGNRHGLAWAHEVLGAHLFSAGRMAESRDWTARALDQMRDMGDLRGAGYCINNLGMHAWISGDFAGAKSLFLEAAALRRSLADGGSVRSTLTNLGRLYWNEGELQRASEALGEAREITRRIRNRRLEREAAWIAAVVRFERGEEREGLQGLADVGAAAEEAGEPYTAVYAWGNRALLLRRLGRAEEARLDAERARALPRRIRQAELDALVAEVSALCLADASFLAEAIRRARAEGAVQFLCQALIAQAELAAENGTGGDARPRARLAAEEALELASRHRFHRYASRAAAALKRL